jgi:hypothetical protein
VNVVSKSIMQISNTDIHILWMWLLILQILVSVSRDGAIRYYG